MAWKEVDKLQMVLCGVSLGLQSQWLTIYHDPLQPYLASIQHVQQALGQEEIRLKADMLSIPRLDKNWGEDCILVRNPICHHDYSDRDYDWGFAG